MAGNRKIKSNAEILVNKTEKAFSCISCAMYDKIDIVVGATAMLELVCSKKRQKNVPTKKLVWEIGDP